MDPFIGTPLGPFSGPQMQQSQRGADDTEPVTRLAESLVQEARYELAQAEAKAVWLLSAAVIALGAILSGAESGSWSPSKLGSPVAEVVLWASLAAAAPACTGWLIRCCLASATTGTGTSWPTSAMPRRSASTPRTARRSGPTWGPPSCRRRRQTDNLDRLADRVFDISTIVLTKYRRIRKAMQALGMSALLFGLAMALEVLFG